MIIHSSAERRAQPDHCWSPLTIWLTIASARHPGGPHCHTDITIASARHPGDPNWFIDSLFESYFIWNSLKVKIPTCLDIGASEWRAAHIPHFIHPSHNTLVLERKYGVLQLRAVKMQLDASRCRQHPRWRTVNMAELHLSASHQSTTDVISGRKLRCILNTRLWQLGRHSFWISSKPLTVDWGSVSKCTSCLLK